MSFFIRYKCKADIHRKGSLGLTQADTNPLHKCLTTSTLGLCIAIVSQLAVSSQPSNISIIHPNINLIEDQ